MTPESSTPHAIGDERTVQRFAWLPVRLDDGRWVHLRWYVSKEVLEEDYSGWTTGMWVRIGARDDH